MTMLKNTNPVRTGPKPGFDWERDFSWSQINSFEYSPEQWYQKYVLKKKPPTSAAMEFGSETGKRLETDKSYLKMIPRQQVMEYEFKAPYQWVDKNGVKRKLTLIGYADSFCDKKYRLEEYKTGKIDSSQPWTQKKVDKHGQITMYLLMKWLKEKIRPEQFTCGLHWMPTKAEYRIYDIEGNKTEITFPTFQEAQLYADQYGGDYKEEISFVEPIEKNIRHFETRRTMTDLREFSARIERTVEAMQRYCEQHT